MGVAASVFLPLISQYIKTYHGYFRNNKTRHDKRRVLPKVKEFSYDANVMQLSD